MKLQLIWWLSLGAFVLISAGFRYHVRYAVSAQEKNWSLLEQSRLLLIETEQQAIDYIEDNVPNRPPIGVKFETALCDGVLKLYKTHMTLLVGGIKQDLLDEFHTGKFHYYDYSYDRPSRLRTTLKWAQKTISRGIGGGSRIATEQQIFVTWPNHCLEPKLDWESLWTVDRVALKK